MRLPRSLFVHASLLALAGAAAFTTITRDPSAKVVVHEATIWDARPSDIQHIVFEAKGNANKVTLEPRNDEGGRWYFGTIDKAAHPKQGPAIQASIVSIGAAEKLFDRLAPLRALRDAGKLDEARSEELGLSEPEAKLTITFASGPRTLEIGGTTPGGGDRYARDAATQKVYVVAGEVVRDFEWADSRLIERELHAFKTADVSKARISQGEKNRALVRGGDEKKGFWADPGSKETNDETAGNWMQRLDRLRPSEYRESLPEAKTLVVRVEYEGISGTLGFLELVKVAHEGDKADYFIRSERTRLHGKVIESLAKQVEEDLGSILR